MQNRGAAQLNGFQLYYCELLSQRAAADAMCLTANSPLVSPAVEAAAAAAAGIQCAGSTA
jgi:hypothetical protein